LFLFSFDYDSVFRRKNPLAVVAAFRQAFADRPEVVLYIKTTNAERHVAEEEELRAAAAGRSNIIVRDGYVSSDDYFSMLDACDCYVSLHRSEGFGLTVAEAMALAKPVISTAYSSTLEFANESNSFLVPARLTEVGDDAAPYPRDSRWADPDVAAAAQQMARVYADPAAAAAVGGRARADIETLHSPRARGPVLRRLLDEHRHSSTAPRTSDRSEMSNPTPTASVTVERASSFESDAFVAESLLGSPRHDLASTRKRLLAPLRRLVLRCIRVYWVQQLAIHRALLAAMHSLRRETRADSASHTALLEQQNEAQERSRAEAARTHEQLAELAAEIRALRERIAAMPTVSARSAPQSDPSDDEVAVHGEKDR
jgi:hypothetical protein